MKPRYPHPCTRCGMCCLARPCPVAVERARAHTTGPCPYLRFLDDLRAECRLAVFLAAIHHLDVVQTRTLFGFGAGCCIKARAVDTTTGGEADFASLAPEVKTALVATARRRVK